MTVTKQKFGLVNKAAWGGDGVNTVCATHRLSQMVLSLMGLQGLLGLAYPGLTSVYNGTDPDNDSPGNVDLYSPLFFTAMSEKVVSNPC